MEKILLEIYDSLYKAFGPRYQCPGETLFEVSIGAILTQNTAWTNGEEGNQQLTSELKKSMLKKAFAGEL